MRAAQADIEVGEDILRALSLADVASFKSHVQEALIGAQPPTSSADAFLLCDWFAALTARVTAYGQESLRLSDSRFRKAIDHSTIAVFETDLDNYFTWLYNSRLPNATGQDMIGRRVDEFMSPEGVAQLRQVEDEALQGTHGTIDITLTARGQELHRRFSFDALRDETGKPYGFIGSSVDTTELKRAHKELSRAVAFREQLMGVLGHDLRNPLAAVTGLSALLRLSCRRSVELNCA